MIDLEHGRRYLNQWDLDRRVRIDNFPPGTWVEIYHLIDGKSSALVVEAYEEAGRVYANIPNALLQTFGYLRICVRPSATDTEHAPEEKDIKVVRTEKPEGYIYSETKTLSWADMDRRIKELEKTINGLELSNKAPRIGEVTLLAQNWVGDDNLYSQVVTIDGVTPYSQVDLTPGVEQLAIFYDKDLAFVTENDDGVVTVFAIGQRPLNDYTMQVTIREVST